MDFDKHMTAFRYMRDPKFWFEQDIAEMEKEKKMATKKTSTVTTDEILERLLAAVTAEYKDDAPTAGIVLAQLKDGQFYASVKRYNQPSTDRYGGSIKADKVVVGTNGKKTARSALIDLSQAWLQKGAAKDALSRALEGA